MKELYLRNYGGFFMAKNSKEKQREYDAKRAGRTRNFTAVLYPEDLPENWREKIDETHVKWIESPLHDKDLNPDGQPKKVHHHTLFMFESVKTVEQVTDYFKNIFGEADTGSIIGVATPQTVSDRCALVRYFAHLDNPQKAQYDVSDIIGHNGADPAEILRYSQTETLSMMIEIEKFIEEHNVTELCDLSLLIREDHPEWYMIITTRNTVYFNAFIRSRRHKSQAAAALAAAIKNGRASIDENGEVIENKDE
jgi:hypothetical protein